ncbi:MAG: hypothetical protein ABIJ96_09560 [Elusimicrobiota bacterium]
MRIYTVFTLIPYFLFFFLSACSTGGYFYLASGEGGRGLLNRAGRLCWVIPLCLLIVSAATWVFTDIWFNPGTSMVE